MHKWSYYLSCRFSLIVHDSSIYSTALQEQCPPINCRIFLAQTPEEPVYEDGGDADLFPPPGHNSSGDPLAAALVVASAAASASASDAASAAAFNASASDYEYDQAGVESEEEAFQNVSEKSNFC